MSGFTVIRSEGNPVSGLMIIEKSRSFCDEMKVIDKCTFLEGWLQNLGIV
jgi:hypothetical protein